MSFQDPSGQSPWIEDISYMSDQCCWAIASSHYSAVNDSSLMLWLFPEVSFTPVVIKSAYCALDDKQPSQGLKVNVWLSTVMGPLICRQVFGFDRKYKQTVMVVIVSGSITSVNVISMSEFGGKTWLRFVLPFVGGTDSVIVRFVMLSLLIVELEIVE